MKHFKVLFALAVIAAAVLPVGCETGVADLGVEAADDSGSVALNTKKITVKFVVCNGGWGLVRSEGIVSPADGSYFIYDSASWAGDFRIAIPVAIEDSYVNIRWAGTDAMSRSFLVKGKLPVKEEGRYAVVLDFNEEKNTDGWEVDTQNLEEVYEYGPGGTHKWLTADWKEAKSRSVPDKDAELDADYEEAAPSLLASASGGTTGAAASGTKVIKIKFNVQNGGWGLKQTIGIVSTEDDSRPARENADCAGDFTITARPNVNEGLTIRWGAEDVWNRRTYLKAKIPAGSIVPLAAGAVFTIGLDYNGKGNVATKNLQEVSVKTTDAAGKDFNNAWARAAKDRMPQPEIPGAREIKVKFEVKNGGSGLNQSFGILSTQDDSYLLCNTGVFSEDYYITIPAPPSDEYLNVRWRGMTALENNTVLKAKMKAESCTITIDYNGRSAGRSSVATKNLYDVELDAWGHEYEYKVVTLTPLGEDWEDAMMRTDYLY